MEENHVWLKISKERMSYTFRGIANVQLPVAIAACLDSTWCKLLK